MRGYVGRALFVLGLTPAGWGLARGGHPPTLLPTLPALRPEANFVRRPRQGGPARCVRAGQCRVFS